MTRHGAVATAWIGRIVFAALLFGMPRGAPVHAASPREAFETALQRWDLDAAEARAAELTAPAERDFAMGMVALYRGDYVAARDRLAQAAARAEGTPLASQIQRYLQIATNAASIFAAGPRIETEHADLRFASDKDVLLAAYAEDALRIALPRLEAVVGVRPSAPLRIEFLDDPAKLAQVTELPLSAVRTTGTVGVTKHGRIVMVTPRVMLRGYPWIDTLVHETVHDLLVRRTGNRAPVWLQEGLAKFLETSWRSPEPPPLDPAVAHLLRRAIQRDDLVTFEEMHPSLALLPSQERAALAYAQVETMMAVLVELHGPASIDRLLDAVAAGRPAEEALAAAHGASFDDFLSTWKKTMLARTRNARPGRLPSRRFRSPDDPPDVDADLLGDAFSAMGGGKARKHARLGQLLERRGHLRAAAKEYETARRAGGRAAKDPQLYRRLGRVYLELGRPVKAAPLLDTALAALPDNASLAADVAEAKLAAGDLEGAHAAAMQAIRTNPFIGPVHCVLARTHPDEQRRAEERRHCRPR
ncbi:MAG: hypothetical protein D6705_01670 [Deltaproteobacteria bacterium]|nr:MAG: hypothetical protein D6705_01670 [Deltaproteobacteria bacterium]